MVAREHRLTHALIRLDRLTHNLRLLQGGVGNRPVWPVIKANAYGHGAISSRVARIPVGH
jgi:alanine racemase